MKILVYFIFTIFILVCSQNKAVQAAVLMGADLNDGYAGNVLDAISKRWQPPNDDIQRNVRIRMQINGNGNLISCTTLSSTGVPKIDKSICAVARSIGQYGIPPYSIPLEVYLSFKTGLLSNKANSKTPVQASNNNLAKKELNNSNVQSPNNLKAMNVSSSGIKKSGKPANVLPASSSIPAPKSKESVNNKITSKDELSYDDWDRLEESLNNNTGLPIKSTKAVNVQSQNIPVSNEQSQNIPVRNVQSQNSPQVNTATRDAIYGNRSTYTVANRPPVGGRIVNGVWIPAGRGNSSEISASQGSINSGVRSSNRSAIPPQSTNDAELTSPQNTNDAELTSSQNTNFVALTPPRNPSSTELAPPRNPSSTELTPPTRAMESKPLDVEKNVLDTDNSYTQAVMQKIARYIRVPDSMPNGKHTVEMLVEIGKNGDIGQVNVKKISGTHDLEESVISAIKNIKDMPVPPNNKAIRLNIKFIVEKV